MLRGLLRVASLAALCLGLAPVSSIGNDRSQPAPLGHFRFDGNDKNDGKGEAKFYRQNTEFKDNALYLNGRYELDGQPGGFRALCRTPAIDYETFTVVLRLKAEDFSLSKSNLLTGGTSCRWFCLKRSEAGNLVVTLNNHVFSHEIKGATLEEGKWVVVACAVDVPHRKVLACLNGKIAAKIDLPREFDLEVVKSKWKDSDKVWSFADHSNACVFHGLVDEFLIYDRVLRPEELEKIALRP